MPGLKASPGMADINVCYGAYGKGSEGVQTALQKARWRYHHAPLQKSGTLDLNRYSGGSISPLDSSADEAGLEDTAPSSPSVHDGFSNVVSPPLDPVSPLSPDVEESGLPPTPPTLPNGSSAADQYDGNQTAPALFADGVRNALRTEKSTTPVMQQASPPTPDPSPPRRLEDSATPLATRQEEQPQLLHASAGSGPDEQDLDQYPSTHTDLIQPSGEDRIDHSDTGMPSVQLPEEDTLPQHWLDTTRDLQTAGMGMNDMMVEATPEVAAEGRDESTPNQELPTGKTMADEVKNLSDHDEPTRGKGMPYIQTTAIDSPSERRQLAARGDRGLPEVNGLGLSGFEMTDPAHKDAQEQNNRVYKRIQEENVMRHSAVSAKSGAIPVGVIYPAPDSTPPKTLKRQTKCYSLRSDTGNDSEKNSETNSQRDHVLLLNRKARRPAVKEKLGDSPVFRPSIRQVSSPAKLGADASDMTALTFASMQDSPTARKAPQSRAEPAHKLRHFSPQDRLTNNLDVRRTSLEASPPLMGAAFQKPILPASKLSQGPGGPSKVAGNTGVVRSNATGSRSASQPLRMPKQRTDITPLRVPEGRTDTQPSSEEMSPSSRLRHFSHEARLENNERIRRTSLDRAAQSPQQPIFSARSASFDKGLMPSSPRKSIDARHHYPTTTPMSTSQFSDRTDNIEIGEANGVRLYPHNNDSLLLIQHASRPTSKGKESSRSTDHFNQNGSVGLNDPVFAAKVVPPTPTLATSRPAHQVDSPLINPRTAPEPPSFKVIPPTPERELLEKENEAQQQGRVARPVSPRKRLSLYQRARRYSDILLPGLGSLRKPNDRHSLVERDRFLSPLWRPQGFWDDFDSEDEDYDDFEAAGTLPRGGDTSDIDHDAGQQRKALFPRAMSKRLPGFRGTGGFLVGNSLGIDRHGTNKRRHYVSTGSRTLSKRQSEEFVRAHQGQNPPGLQNRDAPVSSSQSGGRRAVPSRAFVIPFTGGSRAYWVGMKRFQAKMRALRVAREERAREKKRAEIRSSIGYRVYHDRLMGK